MAAAALRTIRMGMKIRNQAQERARWTHRRKKRDTSGRIIGTAASADVESDEGSDELSYRSDIARATAQVYDAVVSIVMKSEEETVDWDKIYAIGSGIVFRIEGDTAYIVTNHHVAAAAEDLEIVLADGRKKAAELIGSDVISDLAVLSTGCGGHHEDGGIRNFCESPDRRAGDCYR